MSDNDTHREMILDQFTKQAPRFQEIMRSAETAIRLAVEFSEVSPEDTVLDAACGPGVLACALAGSAGHVTGIDITPAMLDHARSLQAARALKNVDWELGEVGSLPFEPETFSLVISRYAIHHFQTPAQEVSEMARVCKPGGRVVLIDSAPSAEKSGEFNRLERMRDPSHIRALTGEGLLDLMLGAGLTLLRSHLYAWETPARGLLERSFPAEGDAEKLLKLYEADIGIDGIGMNARHIQGELHVTFPTLILVGSKGG